MRKNKIMDMLVALLLALCLWGYVVSFVITEDDSSISNVSITYVGENDLREENGLIISNRSVRGVTLKFHGPRTDLKRLLNESANVTVTVDVSKYSEEGEYSADYKVILPSALQDAGIQVTGRSPQRLQFTLEKLDTRTVPVKGVFDGTTAEGYTEGGFSFDRDRITVTGPKKLVDAVSYAQVIMGGKNLSADTEESLSFTLINSAGERIASEDITSDVKEVAATLRILREKEVPLSLRILPGGGATEENTAVALNPDRVVVRGPARLVDGLESLELGTLDLGTADGTQDPEYEIALPDGITLPNGETTATARITFPGFVTVPVTLTEVELLNTAPDLRGEWIGEPITVTLRGTEEAMQSPEEIRCSASADLSDYRAAGSYEVPVKIRCGEEELGAVGEYSITVRLEPTEE